MRHIPKNMEIYFRISAVKLWYVLEQEVLNRGARIDSVDNCGETDLCLTHREGQGDIALLLGNKSSGNNYWL